MARDAAGRGLKVMLAERGDYACATSSASSKLIHGGLRYLESGELGLVRESLAERAGLLKTAPHLVAPLRFLLPIYSWQKRQALKLRAGLALYDVLSLGGGLPASGRLDDDDISQLPRLRQDDLVSVLRYWDCIADDARVTLAVLLDARARGADIRNRRAVTAIAALNDGYAVELDERGVKRRVEARFIVNAAGPWLAAIDAITGLKGRLQDYALRAATGGKDAIGEVAVKVDFDGTVVSGRGASTDVIEASARAYLSALNRLAQPAGQRVRDVGP